MHRCAGSSSGRHPTLHIGVVVEPRDDDLVSGLTDKLNFGADEAKSFVPALLEKVGGLFQSGALTIGDLLQGLDVSSVLGKLDLSSLASKFQMTESKTKDGAEEVISQALDHVKDKMGGGDLGGLSDLLGGGDGPSNGKPDLGNLFQ